MYFREDDEIPSFNILWPVPITRIRSRLDNTAVPRGPATCGDLLQGDVEADPKPTALETEPRNNLR